MRERNQSLAAQTAAPLTLAVCAIAIWTSLPELALINLELWTTVYLAVWALAHLLPFGEAGLWLLSVLFGLPAAWLTVQTLRLALAAYRTAEA